MLYVLFLLFLFIEMPIVASSGPKQCTIALLNKQKAECDIIEIIGLAQSEDIVSSNPLLKNVTKGQAQLQYLSAPLLKDSLFALAHSLKSTLDKTESKGPLYEKLLDVLKYER